MSNSKNVSIMAPAGLILIYVLIFWRCLGTRGYENAGGERTSFPERLNVCYHFEYLLDLSLTGESAEILSP